MTEQVLAVQRMQDHIEAHIDERLELAALAKVSLFSPWYSYRLFQMYTGLTPAEYVRRLRLAKAALRLKNEHVRLIDVAFSLGFGSADGFTRAFIREFGIRPSVYAATPVPIPLFVPYGAKYRAIREERKEQTRMPNTQTIFVRQIQKPARRVICKRGVRADDYFPYCEEVGCDVWGLLCSMDSLCGEPVCLWLPKAYQKPNTSTYVQGVEVPADYSGAIPDGFDVIDLPATEYLQFQGEPFAEEDYCTAISAVQEAMNRYDPTGIGCQWNDDEPRIQLVPRGERGYIELRAVRSL